VTLFKGLDKRLEALAAAAKSLSVDVRPDVLYPVDYVRNVNRGRVGIGSFVVASELTAAEGVLARARTAKDPYKGRNGDMERHHVLEGSGEIMPYRVFVPKAYKGRPTPLVIALHGLGVTEDSFFDSYERMPVQLAEQHGFLLAAPLGFRVDGFYGSEILRPTEPADKRKVELSEKDVLEVLRLMRASYNVDTTRVYLLGHSMGAIGAWHLAAKYPERWAGVAAFAGTGNPGSVERMKAIPQFVVHGDADATVNVFGSRSMVAVMNRLGMKVTYIEVPAGTHNEVVVPNLAKAFEFLAAQHRQ
jgi:predicted peptidase